MATVNLGSIKFKWKGTYSGATAYTIDDVVEYNGSSYICVSNSTGNLPTNATYFEQMSSAGTNGTDGTDLTTTLTTQGDIVYRDASGLQRLGAGTSGQLLQSGGTGANVSWTDAPAGITEADQWRTTTTHTVSTAENTIDANWERNDTYFGVIGTGMTESSGIFTFPSTGIWYVTFQAMATSNGVDYVGVRFELSNDGGSTYTDRAEGYDNTYQGSAYCNPTANIMIDVDNTTNWRIRFKSIGSGSNQFLGSTSANYTYANFIRLGDR